VCADSGLEHAADMARHDLGAVARVWRSHANLTRASGVDEVAIHLRVGDVLKAEMSPPYGLSPWWLITRALANMSQAPRSIGVITAASRNMARKEDKGTGDLGMAVRAPLNQSRAVSLRIFLIQKCLAESTPIASESQRG
jgi:hypothetical protein